MTMGAARRRLQDRRHGAGDSVVMQNPLNGSRANRLQQHTMQMQHNRPTRRFSNNSENFHCYLTCSNKQNQQNLSQTERLWWQQCGPNGQTLLVSDTQGPNLIVFGNGWASVASAAKRARVKNNNENFHCYLRGRGLTRGS